MNNCFDFTLQKLTEILDYLLHSGYSFQTMEDFMLNPAEKVVILRHDVDRSPLHSLQTAKLENSRAIRGTYYFRIVKQSNHPEVIEEIAALGHEIGYHYEDLSLCGGNFEKAILAFKSNLDYFRSFYPVKTICMHGSPTSKWDNRDLWKKYKYREFGITAEPYFDLDYNSLLYITDTGRKWNGDKSSVRDKISQKNFQALKQSLKSSNDILAAISNNVLPGQILITVHPQRWTDNPFIWLLELISQSIKNLIKQLVFVR